MRSALIVGLVLGGLALATTTACDRASFSYRMPTVRTWSGKTTGSGFVAGGGTITSTRSVIGPYGVYPVSGISVGPDGTTVYDAYGPYGYAPYGPYGDAYGTYADPYGTYADPYGYGYGDPYGYPYGGTYTRCTGAVDCGASTTVTVESMGVGLGR